MSWFKKADELDRILGNISAKLDDLYLDTNRALVLLNEGSSFVKDKTLKLEQVLDTLYKSILSARSELSGLKSPKKEE